MTKIEKDFIEKYINLPWSVQLLTMAEAEFVEGPCMYHLPFNSMDEILEFGDVHFYLPITCHLAMAYLPENSPLLFYDMNALLKESSGHYVATIAMKHFDNRSFGNISPDMFLSNSIIQFKRMTRNIQDYIACQRRPKFDQSALDAILDELKYKSVNELSPLNQIQLKRYSELLMKKSNHRHT